MMVSLLPSFFTEFFFLNYDFGATASFFVCFFSNNFFRFFFPLETKCRLSLSLSLFVFFCLNVRLWFVFVTGLPVCVCVLVCVLRGFCTGVGQRRSSRWVPPLSLSLSLSLSFVLFFLFFLLLSFSFIISSISEAASTYFFVVRRTRRPEMHRRRVLPSCFFLWTSPWHFQPFLGIFTGFLLGYLVGFTGFDGVLLIFGGFHWIGLGFIDI